MQTSPNRNWRALLLAIFSLIGIVMLVGAATFLTVTAAIQSFRPLPTMNGATLTNFLLASGLLLCAALLVPGGYYALQQIKGKTILPAALPPTPFWQLLAILAVWILVAFAAEWLGGTRLAWLLLPPLALIGISLPVLALLRIGAGGLPVGSRRRAWGVFGVGMIAGPALATLGEFLIYLAYVLVGVAALALHPEWMVIVQRLSTQLDHANSLDQIVTVLGPYLMNPVVILLMLLALSVFTPLIEELVKPLGVWLLARRALTPGEGFALGVLSGAGFALLESLVATASNDSGWGLSLVVRAGGGVMHILNTGLMGWAIASAWHERRFLRLAGVYVLVVTLHGLWNGLTVMIILGGLRMVASPTDMLGAGLTGLGALTLVALSLGGLIALFVVNHKLRPAPPVPNPTPALSPIEEPASPQSDV
jgi:hypothetical protein